MAASVFVSFVLSNKVLSKTASLVGHCARTIVSLPKGLGKARIARNRRKKWKTAVEFPGMKQSILLSDNNVDKEDKEEGLFTSERDLEMYQALADPETRHIFHEQHKREAASLQKKAWFKMIERMYFKTEPEPCLVSWATKEQMRFLNKEDPQEWTPQRLAEAFPVSKDGAIKILKNKWAPRTREELQKHDDSVRHVWRALKTGKDLAKWNISDSLAEKLRSRLNLQSVGIYGISSLPMGKVNTRQLLPPGESAIPPAKGPFTDMIKDLIHKSASYDTSANIRDGHKYLENPSKPTIVRNGKVTLSGDVDKRTSSMECMMEENPVKKFSRNKLEEDANHSTDIDKAYADWLAEKERQFRPADPSLLAKMQEENVNQGSSRTMLRDLESVKYTDDNEKMNKLQFDKHRREAFLYSTKHGYENPLGKQTFYAKHIEVPRTRMSSRKYPIVNRKFLNTKNSSDVIYRKGDVYYDENGEFLYRVPNS